MKRLICALLLVATMAQAQSTFEGMVSFSGGSISTSTKTVGWSFTPQISIQVTDLGCFDQVFTSAGPVDIGLWTATGQLLQSAVVFQTNTLVNLTRYVGLASPVFLNAGSSYRIGAFSANGLFFETVGSSFGGSATLSSDLSLGSLQVSTATGTFTFPDISGAAGTAMAAPNLLYTRIPEPAASALLGLAALVFAFRRRP